MKKTSAAPAATPPAASTGGGTSAGKPKALPAAKPAKKENGVGGMVLLLFTLVGCAVGVWYISRMDIWKTPKASAGNSANASSNASSGGGFHLFEGWFKGWFQSTAPSPSMPETKPLPVTKESWSEQTKLWHNWGISYYCSTLNSLLIKVDGKEYKRTATGLWLIDGNEPKAVSSVPNGLNWQFKIPQEEKDDRAEVEVTLTPPK